MDSQKINHLNSGFIDMRKTILYIIFTLSLNTFCCKEVYNPEISTTQKILVVDGFITNEAKVFTIRLSTAVRFDSTGYIPETGANVYITDNLGNRFDLTDHGAGNYMSDSTSFIPQIGLKYTLNIETKNKKEYKSSEQEMLPKGTLSEVSNKAQIKPFYLTVDGDLRSVNVTGAEFLVSLNLSTEKNPYFRFSNTVFLEFISRTSLRMDYPYYCWKRYNPNEYFNINDNAYSNSGQFEHDLGFFPVDTFFYSIVKERVNLNGTPPKFYYIYKDVYQYITSFKQYHLNKDVYQYYQLLNKLLEAKQRILDPVAFQISGNITCLTDPNEQVFGMFEASSTNTNTYVIDRNLTSSSYQIRPISLDLDRISDSGISDSIPPSFWVY